MYLTIFNRRKKTDNQSFNALLDRPALSHGIKIVTFACITSVYSV